MILGSTTLTGTPMASGSYSGFTGNATLPAVVLNDVSRSVFVVEFAAKQNSYTPPPFDEPEPIAGQPIAASAPTAFIGFNAPEFTFRFCDIPYYPAPYDTLRPNQIPYAALLNPGDIERSVAIAIEDQARGTTSFGEFEIANGNGRFDAIFDEYNPDQRVVRIYLGPKWADFSLFFQVGAAVCSRWYKTREKIIVPISAVPLNLDQDFQSGVYDGTGNLGGDPALAGRARPFCFGYNVFNISPVLINNAFYIYQVNSTEIAGVTAVKDRGLPLTGSFGDYPDYFELRDAPIPPGYYGTCNRLGLFRANWAGGSPEGQVTCDVNGLVYNTLQLVSTGEFIEYVLTVVAGVPDSRLDIASVRALPPGQIAYYHDGSNSITINELLDDILKPINGFFYIDRQNKFLFKTHEDPDSATIIEDFRHGLGTNNDILSMEQEQGDVDPIFNLQYKYARNWTVMTEDQLSPAVPQSDKIRLKAEYSTLSVSDAELQFTDASAKAVSVDSYFNDKQDTTNIASQQLIIRGKRKEKHIVQVKLKGMAINPGDVISITHPRFAPSGKNFIVFRTVDRLDQYLVELGVYG